MHLGLAFFEPLSYSAMRAGSERLSVAVISGICVVIELVDALLNLFMSYVLKVRVFTNALFKTRAFRPAT